MQQSRIPIDHLKIMMQTRSMKLALNGRSSNKQAGFMNNTEVTSNTKLALGIQEDMKTKLYKQAEIEIPKPEKAYTEEVITTEKLEEGYNKMIKENLELQKRMKDIKEKIRIQDKRIKNISIDLIIQTNDTRETFECIEKDKN